AAGTVSVDSDLSCSASTAKASAGSNPLQEAAMRRRMIVLLSAVSLVLGLWPASAVRAAEDGASLYKQLCASCHDAGTDRAPNREALLSMSAERVLSALESGPMLSMAAGRTGTERRAIAEFVAGKPFDQALS